MSTDPDDASRPRHGGDLAFATMRYGRPRDGWLDLSTGINPNSYPAPDIAASALARLPGRSELATLIATARAAYGVPHGTVLTAMPGTEIGIRLLPHVAPAGSVAIVSPTYGSHADAWRGSGRALSEVPSLAHAPPGATVVIVGNPNNPDGRVLLPDELVAVGRRLAAGGGLLVVDEAFADIAPELSIVPRLNEVPALVLRSLGKFYGLAGVRLGFIAGSAVFVDRIAIHLGDWPVSTAAIVAGTAALGDDGWRAATRGRLKEEMARLRVLLSRHRLTVIGGTDLFVLVEDVEAATIHHALAGHGIWTRAFDRHPQWIRFGLPGDDAGFRRLDEAFTRVR